jgi:uncharacterized membrane protein YphA (DoxX/SURF4 family)
MSSHTLAVIASLVVAAVFLVSGASKIATPSAWRASLAGLGVPSWLAVPVPVVELAVGALLLVQWHRAAVAWVAVVVLVVFTALLVRRLAQGQRPPCACFGSLSSKPIGVGHLVRNAAFLAAALVAALA